MMDLPNLFSAPVAEDKQFLALVLTDSSVHSVLWKVRASEVILIRQSEAHIFQNDEEAIIETDASLQELGKESEDVTEVVFGLEPDWVTDNGIADAKKPFLKQLTQKLSLKAVGFVVITEALFQHFNSQQAQLTALLVQISRSQLRLVLIKGGKFIGSEVVGSSGEVAADIVEALARFKSDEGQKNNWPTKMILYSTELSESELMDKEQALISFDWVKQLSLLQPPLIETLPSRTVIDIVTKQAGKAVAQSQGLLAPSSPQTPTEESVTLTAATPTAAEFGFSDVPEETLANVSMVTAEPEQELAIPEETLAQPTIHISHISDPEPEETAVSPFVNPPASPHHMAATKKWTPPAFSFKGLGKNMPPKMMIIGAVAIGLLLFVGIAFAYLGLTSQVMVAATLKSVPIAEETTLTIDPEATSSDPSQLILAGQSLTKEVTGSKTMASTGVKVVGDKAKGKVTVFNKTTSTKTFTAGTALKTGKLQFVLDEEVTVASASVSTSGGSETKTYGKADVNMTASSIGAESNIGKKTDLTIANFDTNTYSATSEDGANGGASREVRVVSEQDRQKALTDLRKELVDKAQTDFKNEGGSGTYTIPTGKVTVKESVYSAKVGEEVSDFSLDLTAVLEAVSYRIEDVQPLAVQVLQDDVPPGYALATENVQLLTSPAEEAASDSSKVKLAVQVNAHAKPSIDQEALKAEITGKSLTEAKNMLEGKAFFQNLEFIFKPSIARFVVSSLPATQRITFDFK